MRSCWSDWPLLVNEDDEEGSRLRMSGLEFWYPGWGVRDFVGVLYSGEADCW